MVAKNSHPFPLTLISIYHHFYFHLHSFLFRSFSIAFPFTVFAEIFVAVLISDVTFITKFKKLNNWRCRGQHAKLARH